MKLHLFLVMILLSCGSVRAQSSAPEVRFAFALDGKPLRLGTPYYNMLLMDSVKLETVKFYVSDLTFHFQEEKVARAAERFYLIDAADANTHWITWHPEDSLRAFDRVEFTLGLDSLTNAQGGNETVLDSLHGMYVGARYGYVNFKIEGSSPACPAPKNRFEYYLGGNAFPHSSTQLVSMKVAQAQSPVIIELDLGQFFLAIDFITATEVKEAGRESARLLEVLAISMLLQQ